MPALFGDPAALLGAVVLTLNPLPHIDPLGALTFVVAGFGWAKPVPVDVRNLRHPVRDMAWVAAAGPASNFAVAFLGLVAFAVAQRTAGVPLVGGLLAGVFLWVYRFNLALAIFNLIPAAAARRRPLSPLRPAPARGAAPAGARAVRAGPARGDLAERRGGVRPGPGHPLGRRDLR